MDDKGFMSSGDFLLSRPLSLSIPVDSYCPRQPTLQEVLSNIAPQPWTLGAFTVYLSQNHCLEVLEFTLDAKRYTTHYQVMVERDPLTPLSPATQDCEYVKMLWVKLLDAYIAPNASREVNLPSDIRDHLLSLPCTYTPPDSAELEPAVKIIYEIMDEAVLVPFLNSVTPSRGPESVASPWTSNESMSDTYMTGSLDKRSLSPVRSRNQRDRSPPSNGSGSDVVSQSYSGPSLRHSHQSHLTAALGLSRLPANISGLSGTSSGEAIESMTDDSIDSPSPSGSALEPRTPPNTPPTSNASPRSNSSWKKMGDKLRWKKSRSGHGSGSNTGSSRYPIDREGGEEPGLEGRQVTSSPNDNFSIIPTPIIAPTEYPIAGYSSHRQERKKTAFVHGGTSLRLSESWGSPELVAHPGLPVEITSHRPFLPTSAAAQRLYYESDEELLKYEKSKLGKIEGVKKDGVAAEGYFSVGNRVASSENDSTKFLAKRMQVAGPQPFYIPAKVPEDEEIPHVPVPTVSTPGSVAQDDKSMVDTSVESSVMDFDFETDNGVWISAHPTAHESRTSLSTTTTAASTLMDNQYSQYSHGALTLDTSVASSAASTTSSAANMMPSTASIQSASTATSSDIYGWEEEQGRKVSLESGNQDWDYVRRIPQRGRIVGPRARGGVKDHQFRRTDGKRRSLLYRVLNLSSSRSAAASSISSITGLQGAEDRLVETDVNRDFSTLEDPSKKLALSDPEEEEEEEEEEDRTGLTECLTLKSDTENTGFESQFLKSSSVTKILETQSVQPSQFGIKSKKEEDASGPGDISIGVPEDPAGIGSQKSSAVQQELGQGSRPSNHAYVDDANDSKTEDSTLLKSSNTSACSDSDPDTTEPQHASITGYTTGSSDKSDEIYDDRMAVTETFASTEITESLDSPGCQFRLSEMDEGLLPPEMYGRHRRTSDASDTSKSSTAPSTALSISTIASLSSMSSILGPEEAAERLVEVLFGDATLRELYHEALSRVTVERLERNLRRLLKLFAIELRKEAETPEQRAAAGFVRNRARNSAHIICNKLGRGKFVVELKSLNPTIELTLPTQDALGEISDNNSNSDSPDDDPAELGQLERFIVTARAFESLRSNLRLFIYPDEAGGMNNKAVHESSAENITQGADHLEKNDLQASDCQVSGSEGRANLTDDWRTVPNPENIPWEDMAKVGNEVLPQEYVASLKYMLSKFATAAQALWRREPEIPDGKRRVRWKCVSSVRSFNTIKPLLKGL